MVPANVPALVLYEFGNFGGSDDGGARPRLTTEDGGSAVPVLSVEGHLLRLGSPLEPNSDYVLHFDALTADSPGRVATQRRIRTGGSAPLPQAAGTLSVGEVSAGEEEVTRDNGSCSNNVEMAFAKLGFAPSEELKPFLPLTRFELKVDGKTWATTGPWPAPGYGVVSPDGTIEDSHGVYYETGDRIDRVFAACEPRSGSTSLQGTTPGKHRATLVAYLAGGTWFESNTVDFELSCPSSPFGCSAAGPSTLLGALLPVALIGLSRRRGSVSR